MRILLQTGFIISVCAGISLGEVAAQPAPSASAPTGQPPAPPPEAVAACQGKSEGAQVSFSGPHGETFSGICRAFNGKLAAAPAGGPPPAH